MHNYKLSIDYEKVVINEIDLARMIARKCTCHIFSDWYPEDWKMTTDIALTEQEIAEYRSLGAIITPEEKLDG